MADQPSPGPATEPADTSAASGANFASTYANQFYVTVLGTTVRIAFGETVYGNPNIIWRTAIVLPLEVGLQLGPVIAQLFQQVQQPSGGAASPPATPPSGDGT